MRALVCLLSTWLSLSSAVVLAAKPPKELLPYSSFELPNGLRVLVHEDHTVPIVAVEVYYHVGSKDEVPGKTGFAHLFEHLMFKGSRNVADGQHFQAITSAGGTCNATTNRDRTNYFEVLPSSFLERAMFLESDRMAHLLDGVTQATLDNQRDVVRNERRQNYENRPYGRARRPTVEALYPAGHPYHWLTIGDHADLMRATLDDVRSFFRAHYRPNNATLVVSGDAELAAVKALAQKYFAPIPSESNVRAARPPVLPRVPLAEEKVVELNDQVSLERVTLAWPSVAAYEKGDAAFDLLTSVLGPGSGRLHRRLVHELQIAQTVAVAQESELLAGDFAITVTLKPGHTAAEAVAVIDEELGKLQRGEARITAAELEEAKNRFEADLYFSLLPAGGLYGRADRLAAYDYYTGDPGYLMKDIARYRAVTLGELEAAAKQLGKGRVRVVIHASKKADAEVSK